VNYCLIAAHELHAGTVFTLMLPLKQIGNSANTLSRFNNSFMKKFIAMALVAVSVAACNDDSNTSVTTTDTSTIINTDTTATGTTVYTASEGDLTYRDKKLMVWRNGAWVESNEDVRLENGVVVYRTGKVTRDGKEVKLEDGEVVTRTGNFFDRSGQAIENAWDKTKEGVKDAGKAVGNAAEKAAHSMKDAVDGDKDKN
jgi:hypothetical protein